MKKTLLALAVPALLAASAANAATVYEKDGQKFEVTGRAQANYYNNAASDGVVAQIRELSRSLVI